MLFNYEKFEKLVQESKNVYNTRLPFPYAIFDGFFDDKILDEINLEIEEANFKEDKRSIEGVEVKTRSDFEDNESLPPKTRLIFEIINGGRFLNIISKLTGINGLISDPYYDGGGINVIKNGGTLAVHVDGTNQKRMNVSRRINAIIFLNENWNPKWNGYHEQWEFTNKDLSPFDKNNKWRCVRKILPKKNRLYVFTTNDHSWHGHAGVLSVPKNIKRKSLISYYYTSSRPKSDIVYDNPHRALFINNSLTLLSEAFKDTEVIL